MEKSYRLALCRDDHIQDNHITIFKNTHYHSQYSKNDNLEQTKCYSNKQTNIQSNEYSTQEHHHPHELEQNYKNSV